MDHARARWGDDGADDSPGTGVSPGRLGRWGTAAGVAAGIARHAGLNPTADTATWVRHGGRLSEHRKTNYGRKGKPKISD